MNILLIGPRACGKTSIGRELAHALNRPFVDLDDVALERFAENSVVAVWEAHGEQAWREAEVAALKAVLSRERQVIALGGGTVMIDAARQMIESARAGGRACCVYLRCSADELCRRLGEAGGDRPSLTGRPVADEVAEVLAQREPTYRRIADIELDVTSLDVKQASDELQQRMEWTR